MADTTTQLLPEIRTYCEQRLSDPHTSLSAVHQAAAEQVRAWVRQRRAAGLPAELIVVCTGNSRRSCLGSTLGNIVAAFRRDSGVRFFSGGTSPTAFNPRTIRALREIGVQITVNGQVAPTGPSGDPNPQYQVRWGTGDLDSSTEFSKRFNDPANPHSDFCAIMVCTDADENCPVVTGASLRVSMPFEDPKEFDGQPAEGSAYSNRRDQICQAMLLILSP